MTPIRTIAVAAILAVALFASRASAQLRVGNDGHARDANPQSGSGGFNDTTGTPAPSLGQEIVTGNVTGGFGFSGKVVDGVNTGAGYTDQFAFRGLLPGEGIDYFNSRSAGVPTLANPNASSQSFATGPTPYYGAISTVQTPPNFIPDKPISASGYVPAPPVQVLPNDTRLGDVNLGLPPPLPKEGEFLGPGPVDAAANVNWSFSSLYGARQWSFQSPAEEMAYSNEVGNAPFLTPQDLIKLRMELNSASNPGYSNAGSPLLPNSSQNPSQSATSGNNPGATPATPGSQGNPLNQTPIGTALTPASNNTNVTPQAGDFSTNQSTQYVPPPPPAAQQSIQYQQLLKKYQEYKNSHPVSDEQAIRQFRELMKARQNLINGTPPALAPGGTPTPSGTPAPGGTATPAQAPGQNPTPPAPGSGAAPSEQQQPTPMHIDSLAVGVQAKGMAELLAKAENSVRTGQFDQAIGQYNQAAEVAPNNPLILIGRAEAELGGSYYQQADNDLHEAISADPEVLLAQFDLVKLVGDKRLKDVETDLTNLARHDDIYDESPAFLLSYLYYNTNQLSDAAAWLAAADKRSGGKDPTLVQMEKYWKFDQTPAPATPPAPPAGVTPPHATHAPQKSSTPTTRP